MSHSSGMAAKAMDPRKIAARNKKKATRSSLAIGGTGPQRTRRRQGQPAAKKPCVHVDSERRERTKQEQSDASDQFEPDFSASVSGRGLAVPNGGQQARAKGGPTLAQTAPLQRDVPASMRATLTASQGRTGGGRDAPNPWGHVPANNSNTIQEVYHVDAVTGKMTSGPVRSRPSSRRMRPPSSPSSRQGLSITSQSLSHPMRMKPPHRVDPIPHAPPMGTGGPGHDARDEVASKQRKQEELRAALAEQMREKKRRLELEQQMERERDQALQGNPWSSPVRASQHVSSSSVMASPHHTSPPPSTPFSASVRHVSSRNAARHSTSAFHANLSVANGAYHGDAEGGGLDLNASFMGQSMTSHSPAVDGASIAHLNKQGFMHVDERERKRMQQLAQQESIRQQIEEKKRERQRRLEAEQREEELEQQRIIKEQEKIRQQYEDEKAARRRKEEEQQKRIEALQALKEADEAKRAERQRAAR
ncbi:hypothetical protein PTSG_05681 [Salpingoeca rosetta]|uniref:CCDC66 domain-containing protein n=1 Tax=Salpingoeca rosetta (strain ATCC 50818 / BSB-021) TaxID=946362 RepID=F2UBX0_SALR5|nr:uncharacterized protein PTSG_05681 [Salpingoeca rosetta]EGD73986.1 hypothetical protein PTSG_05681 [Salpingoeca rosetta]|eukprot:XP_004993549.1 hypothetical protein PTSG_05681 [Salpingoeca rosetta]